ncbi:DUF3846 domain-containing protein [Streptomyces sp. NBC_01361]|uniref:DUF3846 domain-containing protein n=1 Tax=Streptomyces sp. NBC_01361 TaxID=2903838 RepID=UPI002E333564|nr:hypothetical protein [Streptomyces sp. NBC_01361]
MPVTATTVETFALWVSSTGTFRLLDWGTAATPQRTLCCDAAQPVSLTGALTMWEEGDAFRLRRPRNPYASALLLAYQPYPGLRFGDVVFTGATDPRTDAVHGLTEDQALTLLDLYLLRVNAHVPGARHH